MGLGSLEELYNDFCNNQIFKDTILSYPVALGFDADNQLQIDELTSLGNILLFGNTGTCETYMRLLLFQFALINYKNGLSVVLYDDSGYKENYDFGSFPNFRFFTRSQAEKFIIGDDIDYFFHHLQTEIRVRQDQLRLYGKKREPIIFVVCAAHKNGQAFYDRFCYSTLFPDLKELGIQLIIGDYIGHSSDCLLPHANKFDTVIGFKLTNIPEYEEIIANDTFILNSKGNRKLLHFRRRELNQEERNKVFYKEALSNSCKENKQTDDKVCSFCGKKLETDRSHNNNMTLWSHHKGIKYQLLDVRMQLCSECTDKALDMLTPLCKITPYTNK